MSSPGTLVLGATGFIGRWYVLELLTRGEHVAVGLRGGAARDGELRSWLTARGAAPDAVAERLTTVATDITRPGLALPAADEHRLEGVRDVVNLAARYAFGLTRDEARAANVDGAIHPLHWAAGRPELRRLVHLSGYRVGRNTGQHHPLPAADADRLYRELGAYEASKTEGDIAVRTLAPRLGVPLTVVNPGAVIGHSRTGEAGQYLGLATLVEQLWERRLPALAGTRRTVVPVVAVDHLATFLAEVPHHDREPLHLHTVLDPATPPLPELVALAAERLGLRPPRVVLPVGLVRRLPRALTGVDPETLSFLAEDTYDTASAAALARAAGLTHPPVQRLIQDWAARLVADRFPGAAVPPAPATRP
ncbi:SDR family oxidoreductase [Kitasatospora sp. NPDC093679]|uniref:SDR family oxidoreductase n=1 Tax=Kitasatospora sp. NPDC093679 TaxID=3154983 RepID=UPI003442323F